MAEGANGAPPAGVATDLEAELAKPKSGKVTGVIVPPPDIRAVVDKTAKWVAEKGKAFEERILASSDGKSSKFNFMRPSDPYYAYYELKIREAEEGVTQPPPEKKQKTEEAPAAPAPEATQGEEAQQQVAASSTPSSATTVAKASVLGPIARAALNKPKDAPTPLEFLLTHPESLSALEVDVIKLTAQYTATSGRQFLAGLATREQNNPLFDFLKPTSPMFSYFTSLVDAYTKVLQPTALHKTRAEEGCDRMKVLERVVHRWEYTKNEEERKKAAQAEADAERIAYQTLDWHDFVVVETISFGEDELLELPSLGNLMVGQEGEDMDVDMDMDVDDGGPSVPPPPLPPPPPPRPSTLTEEEDETIHVVGDYTPQVKRAGMRGPTAMIDPVTGREIAPEELSDHMRIQLMDPRWREDQRRAKERQKETAIAEGADIAANLQRLAKKRTDLFGTADEEEEQMLREEEARKKREEESNRIIWDGRAASLPVVKQAAAESAYRAPPPTHKPSEGPGPIGPSSGRAPPRPSYQSQPPGPPPPRGPPQGQGQGPPGPFPGPPPPRPPPMQQQQQPRPPPPHQFHGGGGGPPPMDMMRQPPNPPMQMQQPPPPFHEPPPRDFTMRMVPNEEPDFGGEPNEPSRNEPQPQLMPEAQFMAVHPGPVNVKVQTPLDESNPGWGLNGRVVAITCANAMVSIKEVKEMLSLVLGQMPPGKMQLRAPVSGFLKDQFTLAYYNISSNVQIDLLTKSRGRR